MCVYIYTFLSETLLYFILSDKIEFSIDSKILF